MKRKEIIKLRNIDFSYSKDVFLENVSLSIYEDDFLGIIGPNGGGKTTLLKLILGLLKPSKGRISVFGTSPVRARKDIGYLSQFKNIDFDYPITVSEVVLMGKVGSRLFKRYSKQDKEDAKQAMKRLDIYKYKDKNLNELSGGEKQRVFVARALVNKPKVLLLDEPTSNLDMRIQEEFYNLLQDLNKDIAIVIVDHDFDMLEKYTKEIVCVNKCKTHAIRYHDTNSVKMKEMCDV